MGGERLLKGYILGGWVYSYTVPSNHPKILVNDLTKSRAFFVKKRWHGRRVCPSCNCRSLNRLEGIYQYKQCKFRFSDFTNTYLGKLWIPLHTISHLAYLFILGVPAYRIRFYKYISLRTIERAFMLFWQAIYDTSPKLVFDGEVELDEAMFGGHRKGKRGYGAPQERHSSLAYTLEMGKLLHFLCLTGSKKHSYP